MAKSCLCPGLVTLITNLIFSSGSSGEDYKKEEIHFEWLDEYRRG